MTLTHTLTGMFQRQTLTHPAHPYGVPGIEREYTLTHTLTALTRLDPYESPPLYKGGMSPQAPENGATSTTITSGVDS
jgi:hypothetical protein